MNQLVRILLFAFLPFAQLAHAETLRIMTYNIRNGIGIDNVRDIARISSVINDLHPNIVAIQEVDSMTSRSSFRYILGELELQCGLNAYFAPAIDYDGGKYGVGVLCRQSPDSVFRTPLPGSEERRVLLTLDFGKFILCCTHLSLTQLDRDRSVDIITDISESYKDVPVFLAGDFNALPSESTLQKLHYTFVALSPIDVPTFPADSPVETIDYILCNPHSHELKVTSYDVIPTTASDHRPIVVDVTF